MTETAIKRQWNKGWALGMLTLLLVAMPLGAHARYPAISDDPIISTAQPTTTGSTTTSTPTTTGTTGDAIDRIPPTVLTTGAQSLVNDDGTLRVPADEVLSTIPQAQEYWQNCYAKCHRNHECSAVACANQCKGEVIQHAYNISRIGEIMNYNVKAAYAATCLDKFSDYLKKIRDAAKAAQDSGLSLSTIIVRTIVDQVLDAVLGQIFDSLTNSICNVTNEALGAIDSFMRNAICLPTASLGNPLDFRLNLGRMRCNGWSINALTGQVNGQIIDGVNTSGISFAPTSGTGAVSSPSPMAEPPLVSTTGATPITIDPPTLPSTPTILTTPDTQGATR